MKKVSIIICMITTLILWGCNNKNGNNVPQENNITVTKLSREEIKSHSFSDLFQSIDVKEIPEDIFTLINKDFGILTAGTPSHYNSMVTSWGGWGILFDKPVFFSVLRSNRHTLKLMREQQKYTITFFEDAYKEDMMEFGIKSGNDGNEKMVNSKLTAVQTPAGNMTYKEAKLILECSLFEVTTVSPNDFYNEESRSFILEGYNETGEYHKLVFGEITHAWICK